MSPPDVREVGAGDTGLAYAALKELRPQIGELHEFIERIDHVQRPEGYRLVGVFVDAEEHAVAVAGFRSGHSLAWGYFLYVDDLITLGDFRRQGHAAALLAWVEAEARRSHCDTVHLDSGYQRTEAHTFYRDVGWSDFGLHFGRIINPSFE